MSLLTDIRQSGIIFFNNDGKPEDMLTTLKKAGVNVIRLKLFYEPQNQSSCTFSSVEQLAKELQLAGFKLLLSVHYSDNWADPSQQTIPAKWQNLNNLQLMDSVYAYTARITDIIKPDYIQLGNEINHGLLWPEGHINNLSKMKQLLNKAASAVRMKNNQTKIIIHYAGHADALNFFSNMSDIDYDIIGLSYYPMWHGKNLDSLQQSLQSLSSTFNKKILIAETSYPFTLEWNDWTNNIVGLESQLLPQYPATPAGQQLYLQKISTIMQSIPNGLGYCYWGSEWVSFKGSTATNGSPYENQAFWDFNNKALPVLNIYK